MTFEKLMIHNVQITHLREVMTDWALAMKVSEEVGEFNEAMLKDLGYLLHKKELEGPMGEAANIIIVLVAALAKHYPEKSAVDLVNELMVSMQEKMDKYESLSNKLMVSMQEKMDKYESLSNK